MAANHENNIAALGVAIAHADLVITWALDSDDRRLFATWTAKRARYRMLLSHILESETP